MFLFLFFCLILSLLSFKCDFGLTFVVPNSEKDLALANSLLRPGSLFIEELEKAEKFTEKNYGSVKKVYVICSEDKTITKEFQKWMIQNYGIENVMEIDGADHMAMFSKPLQVSHCLLRVAKKFN